jgi:hypothetical protein
LNFATDRTCGTVGLDKVPRDHPIPKVRTVLKGAVLKD